ncbi:MAG: carbohydrate kinase [Pseudomonadota bacterium]
MILCGGDALIDFVPVTRDGEEAFVPKPGGAVLNTATALARLEQKVTFLGGVSTDLFGDQLIRHMEREGIDTDHVDRTAHDSTLAFVTLAGGEARYAFYDDTSAGRRWTGTADVPAADCLHIASVTLIADPSASAYADLAERVSPSMVVSLDPNCRPTLIRDRAPYAERIKRIAAVSHIVRFSEEDFDYLYPDTDEGRVATDLLLGTPELILISRGPKGATAYWAGGRVDIDALPVDLADSIGAGDTFHAGVLTALAQAGKMNQAGLAALDAPTVEAALRFAGTAAALNCEQRGCNPPDLSDVEARLNG